MLLKGKRPLKGRSKAAIQLGERLVGGFRVDDDGSAAGDAALEGAAGQDCRAAIQDLHAGDAEPGVVDQHSALGDRDPGCRAAGA